MASPNSLYYFINQFNISKNRRHPLHLVYTGDNFKELKQFIIEKADIIRAVPIKITNKSRLYKILRYIDYIANYNKIFFIIEDIRQVFSRDLDDYMFLDLASKGVYYKLDGKWYSVRFLINTTLENFLYYINNHLKDKRLYSFLGRCIFGTYFDPNTKVYPTKKRVILTKELEDYLFTLAEYVASNYVKRFMLSLPIYSTNYTLLKYALKGTIETISSIMTIGNRPKVINKKIIELAADYILRVL